MEPSAADRHVEAEEKSNKTHTHTHTHKEKMERRKKKKKSFTIYRSANEDARRQMN